ncbi:MAG TPA: PepSY domain-containing protein [Gemmatimonadaceae bacterium]|jgi:peptidase YpeB-like protein|nr:PepSY domain-containing protein [Gemmatimonadaceae bacterium]
MRLMTAAAAMAACLLVPAMASAQATYKRDLPDSLTKMAKISEEAAAKTALKRVKKGTIESVELEREKGTLIYSYDIKQPGKSGAEEVNVNAMTGKVVARVHESAATEKKEAAEEKKPAATGKKKP